MLAPMSTPRTFVDLFSEGGPFVVAEEAHFRSWPGSRGWQDVLAELEPPGAIQVAGDAMRVFFDPEDPGPVQVGWTEDSLLLVRWSEGGAPVVFGRLDDAAKTAFAAAVEAGLGAAADVEELGLVELTDGLVVVSWAAYGGADLVEDRAGVEALADGSPRETRRYAGGAPGLTAVRLTPGTYAVQAVFDYYDEAGERGGTWLLLLRS